MRSKKRLANIFEPSKSGRRLSGSDDAQVLLLEMIDDACH